MRVAIIENMKVTHLGNLGVALAEANAQIEIFRPWDGGPIPSDDTRHDAIVVLGGEQNARDDELHPYLSDLAVLMRRFGEAGKAVLGICLGSQILARAYGADNHLGTAPEFGWHSISVNEDGRDDPLFSAIPEEFVTFEWHSDTFSLPKGATRLASTGPVDNQAFRIGRAVYGTQFHFEASTAVVEQWKQDFEPAIAQIEPGWLARYPALVETHGAVADAAGLAIARAWVQLIQVDAPSV